MPALVVHWHHDDRPARSLKGKMKDNVHHGFATMAVIGLFDGVDVCTSSDLSTKNTRGLSCFGYLSPRLEVVFFHVRNAQSRVPTMEESRLAVVFFCVRNAQSRVPTMEESRERERERCRGSDVLRVRKMDPMNH
jgi:hypothetical protein